MGIDNKSGSEVIQIIRKQYPGIRICSCTANCLEQNIQSYIDKGANHVYSKPIDFDQLVKDIKKQQQSKIA